MLPHLSVRERVVMRRLIWNVACPRRMDGSGWVKKMGAKCANRASLRNVNRSLQSVPAWRCSWLRWRVPLAISGETVKGFCADVACASSAFFGLPLRSKVGNTEACETACQFPNRCVYSRCFETPVPDDSLLLRGQPFAPYPFVLEPPRTGKLEYVPGDTLVCHLTLIGEAIKLLPWMVFTLNEVGRRGIGLWGERGRCLLDRVESLPAGGKGEDETIYTAETQMLTGKGLILGLEDVMRVVPDVARRLELEFKYNGIWNLKDSCNVSIS